MSDILVAHRDREVRLILDHLDTHKPKQDRWLALHANVHFHFISDVFVLAQFGRDLVQHPEASRTVVVALGPGCVCVVRPHS